MKIKLFFLFLSSCLLTYLIYKTNTNEYLYITSIYDDTTILDNNYNTYLKDKLNNTISNTYYEYHNTTFEIENIIDKIKSNSNEIQIKLNSSNTIIIYLGTFEIEKENLAISSIYTYLENLFILVRKYNNKQIIYLSPPSISSTFLLKDLCNKYKITFINTSSLLNLSYLDKKALTEDNHKKIANKLYQEITKTWNI